MDKLVDTEYDFRTDSNSGDPDQDSDKLTEYHKILWNKILPNGYEFCLTRYGNKLKSEYYCESLLSSDTMTTGYIKYQRPHFINILKQIPENEIIEYQSIIYTIGNFIIFPCNQIEEKDTINQIRGKEPRIMDRIDLTLECIRLYYMGENNPLNDTLNRYNNFFKMFIDFREYCKYFLLDDFVYNDYKNINFLLPFNNFTNNPSPSNVEEYILFKNKSKEIIISRNKRINDYVKNISQ